MPTKSKSPQLGTSVTVYPVTGRRVRHDQTKQVIGAEGVQVTWNLYYRRLHADGDISLTAPKSEQVESTPSKSRRSASNTGGEE